MRIGVDIDGVLNRRMRFLLDCGSEFCAKSGKGGIQNLRSPHVSEIFGWDKQTRDEFWYEYGALQMFVWPAQNYAAEVIRKLRQEGHEIWIITGRNNEDSRVKGMLEGATWEDTTKDWLAENKIEYDQIHFGLNGIKRSKGPFCRENGIDVMIEDLPEYLEGFVGKTRVLIFDQPYNREVEVPNSERVYAWYDIYSKIRKMKVDK